ncbi:transcriptional regulator BetI [Thalassovita gelatinovora]|uniref:Transcriptional regulator BetI n=1 Tax=Thalassovita gelatinovora TaxID=53501 RepID=A0A0P1FB17_THAGE|nr:TetR/AcrR family transcriptional regulator [Thalassovita gelatinovora]QIZ80701.1 TetR/AcrR family transcriptional regulator [Thalassovita gelatinovora]CUH65289.1 transcriptional regulator BetI [Thalassovita gelatinovora]SEQ88869.1 transcriptional regulator, TetR family [Thalassovita gelatinovora]
MARGLARDHDEKRTALRKGAAAYFAAHGFDRASMTGAAKSCGVSKALIYHYWASKEDLLYDILDDHLGALVEVVEAARSEGLRGLIGAILDAYADADAEHKLQLDALGVLPVDKQTPLIAAQRHLVDIMTDVVLEQAPQLQADPDRLRAATMSVFAVLNWFYMWHRPGKGLSREAYADLATDFAIGGLKAL